MLSERRTLAGFRRADSRRTRRFCRRKGDDGHKRGGHRRGRDACGLPVERRDHVAAAGGLGPVHRTAKRRPGHVLPGREGALVPCGRAFILVGHPLPHAHLRSGERHEPEGERIMKPAAFSYHRPKSLTEALTLLVQYKLDAKVIAGGQSLVPMMNMRFAQPAHLIDLNVLPQLAGVRRTGDMLEIGAMTRHHELAANPDVRACCPLLAYAAATIGHYAIRHRGTVA